MPKATTCILNGRIVDIVDALAVRRRNAQAGFRCRECGQLVRPHKKGTTDQAAHFEHLSKNARCALSAGR